MFVYLIFSLYIWIISYVGVLVEDRQKKCPFKIRQALFLKGDSVLLLPENVPLPSAALHCPRCTGRTEASPIPYGA